MKKTILIVILLFGSISVSTVASAIVARPGMNIPLILNDFQITTDTPILPDWKPEKIRWKLINPSGEVEVIKDTGIDKIIKESQGLFETSAKWSITTNGGFITIPAFAEPGEWKLKAIFYSKNFIFTNTKGYDIETIRVEETSLSENLMAPVGLVFDLPLIGEKYIGFELIYIIGIILILPLIYLVLRKK